MFWWVTNKTSLFTGDERESWAHRRGVCGERGTSRFSNTKNEKEKTDGVGKPVAEYWNKGELGGTSHRPLPLAGAVLADNKNKNGCKGV